MFSIQLYNDTKTWIYTTLDFHITSAKISTKYQSFRIALALCVVLSGCSCFHFWKKARKTVMVFVFHSLGSYFYVLTSLAVFYSSVYSLLVCYCVSLPPLSLSFSCFPWIHEVHQLSIKAFSVPASCFLHLGPLFNKTAAYEYVACSVGKRHFR